MGESKFISGQIVDIENKRIYPGTIFILNDRIEKIEETPEAENQYILPGFIDAHVHIESSMLVPSEFARIAVIHGTVATVSDPHEIANVCGIDGVKFMIENGDQVPFKFYFGAPSCVPATTFETAGAEISVKEIEDLLKSDKIKYLAEMMNWPGVLFKDPMVFEKINIAKKYNKPVDGHAPGLMGEKAQQYIAAGISTDHECFTREEALEKLNLGMKILIREGSAAKNFDALISLLDDYEDQIMFCSDDKHPDSLLLGHINDLVKKAIEKGIDLFKVLKAACVNPVNHYNLDVGLLRKGDFADFIITDNLTSFKIKETYINGNLVATKSRSTIDSVKVSLINNFNCTAISASDIRIKASGKNILVIEALDGQLITNKIKAEAFITNGFIESNPEKDILKIIVKNRYKDVPPAIAFIKNFGLKDGAIASSIAHDSHNIIAVGSNDDFIIEAVNQLISCKGGISAVSTFDSKVLPLPVGGIMTTADAYDVAELYTELDTLAKKMGSNLSSPFMTLSFMALLVIPSLKLSDLGLFDGETFEFTKSESS
ncbi:adenine deaminase [Pedobacter sp. P351]|uniref:adenine deaminase n=1 Tax=Pedobacter superstes TaxID=3133441 RepID=UPI0030AD0BAA